MRSIIPGTYDVIIPTTGAMHVSVTIADETDEEGLLDRALDVAAEDLSSDVSCHEWEFTPEVSEGNVSHAFCSSWTFARQDDQ